MKIRNFLSALGLGIFLLSTLTFVAVNAAGGENYEANMNFSDVSVRHENVKSIEYLWRNDVVVGYEDGTFQPEANINRAEFLKIVMEVSGLELGGEDCYPDVDDQWFAQYVCAATEEGLVDGYPDGTFKPGDEINFAEGSKIVANVLELEDAGGETGGSWFAPFVLSLEVTQSIPADIDGFGNSLTRAQMSEMIWRIDADKTYKPFNTYSGIDAGQAVSEDLEYENFETCKDLHDYLEDNSNKPYYYEWMDDGEALPSDAIAVTPNMAEKGGCFTGETQILMADGSYKSIEDVEAGDSVLTRKGLGEGELVPSDVESTISHFVPGYLVINEELEVTPEHVLLINGEWDVAGSINKGDLLMDKDANEVEVYSVKKVKKPTWVYNFEVKDYHTYIADDYYVHNDKGAAEDFSATNTQVSGVDEADVVKNDGEYIYFMKGQTVRVVDAYPASGMVELDMIDFDNENFYPSEMYLDEDRLVVIGDTYIPSYFDEYDKALVDPAYYYTDGSAKVYIFDVSDPEDVDMIKEYTFEGDYSNSRKVDDVVYIVVNQNNYTWPWWFEEDWKEEDLVPLYVEDGKLDTLVSCEDVLYTPNEIDETNYMIVVAVPLDPDEDISQEVVMGYSDEIYSSRDNLYVTKPKYSWWGWYDELDQEEKTYVHKFSLDGADIDYAGMGVVPGTILNQFSMDEHEGHFRIVTTKGNNWDENHPLMNNLYVLGSDMEIVGSVEGLAEGESVYSARFMGDKAYVVTFKKIDPLFVIDVSDPTDPEVLGELKIPGFSDYLHPYDEDHLIGFGLDTAVPTDEEMEMWGQDFAWFQGVKMAMFDVSDVENPIELHKEIIGDRGSRSPLNYDHKALLYSTTKGIGAGAMMAFPISVAEIDQALKDDPDTPGDTYGDTVFQGAYVYDVNIADGFDLRGTVSQYDEGEIETLDYYWYGTDDVERVIYIGDYLYTLSQNAVMANDIDAPLAEVSRVDFAE